MDTYTVAYRTGGTEYCTWRRTLPFATKKLAYHKREEIETMGYKALVFKTAELNKIGLPEGWEA